MVFPCLWAHEVQRWGRCAVFAVLGVVSAGCAATSSMGQAHVVDVEGAPCFTVSTTGEPASELAFETLYVSERSSQDWRALPAELWAINVKPAGQAIAWKPAGCLRYSEQMPGTSTRVQARPLEHYRVYSVFIGARPKDERGNLLGYKAEFCITQDIGQKPVAREVPWDSGGSRWRYEICDKK
jgi:surface antigen